MLSLRLKNKLTKMYQTFKLTSIVFHCILNRKEIILILLNAVLQLPPTKIHSNIRKTKQNKNNQQKHFMLPFMDRVKRFKVAEPLQEDSLLLTTMPPGLPSIHLIRPMKDKRLSGPWSHLMGFNQGAVVWLKPLTLRSHQQTEHWNW